MSFGSFACLYLFISVVVSHLKLKCACNLMLHQIKKLIEASIIDWKELETSEELKIMKSYAEYSKRYSMIIWGEHKG